MNFKLGIIGHPDVNVIVKEIISKRFRDVSVTSLGVADDINFDQTFPKIISQFINHDGLLFTAKDIYYIFNSNTGLEVPSTHLDTSLAELYKSFFKAQYHLKSDITNLSIDSVLYSDITDAYIGLDIFDVSNLNIKIVPFDYSKPPYIDKIIEAHIKNHRENGSLCMTGFTEVMIRLQALSIPVVSIESDKNQIFEKVNRLISSSISLSQKVNDQVVILISLSNLKEHIVIENSEHSIISEYNRITEQIFWFSQKVNGAYLSSDQKNFSIFCSRDDFENQTDHFSKLEILDQIAFKNIVHASIGIGYGKTINKAMKHAVIAKIKATKENINCAFIKYSDREIAGPLFPSSNPTNNKVIVYDEKLYHIASKSELSISKIYQLHGIIKEKNTTYFTSKELSSQLGVSQRSANRMLKKLEDSGFVQPSGTKSEGGKGRPIRIFAFYF